MEAARTQDKRLRNAQAIVFDVDDTLYLERDYVRSGFAAVELAGGVPGLGDLCWDLFLRGVRGTTFDQALEAAGIPPTRDLVEHLVDVYRKHEPSIALAPDAELCLSALAGRFRLACISDGPLASQQAKVDALGLRRWLKPIILTAQLGSGLGKPDPTAFRMIENATGLPPDRHVYVGDHPGKDIAGPRGVGWQVVRVRRQASLRYADPSSQPPDVEVPDLSGILELL